MRTRMFGAIVALGTLAGSGLAPAHHESSPVWTPVGAVTTPVGVATGGAACAVQTVVLHFKETTFDHSTRTTRGKVFAEGQARCQSAETGVEADMVVSVYQQDASPAGALDTNTIGVTHSLRLLGTARCNPRNALTDNAVCRTPDIAYTQGPGVRLVGTNGTVFTLVDPRGGGWFAWHPSCRLSDVTRMKLWCMTAADARG